MEGAAWDSEAGLMKESEPKGVEAPKVTALLLFRCRSAPLASSLRGPPHSSDRHAQMAARAPTGLFFLASDCEQRHLHKSTCAHAELTLPTPAFTTAGPPCPSPHHLAAPTAAGRHPSHSAL
eukprot:scaffold207092_cov18-Tisochrysis_lutea.AAC.1